MRYLTTFGMVALTITLWNPGTSCAAQEIPSGSYRQTCRDIGMNGSTLQARCQTSNGDWQSAQLPDFQRCASEIVNDNGGLRCNMGGDNWQSGYGRHSMPGGGYTQTCQEIRTSGSTLEANCQTRNGQWNRTTLQNFNQCTAEIENDDGRLVCSKAGYGQGGYGWQGGAPYGSYAQSCQKISTRGSTLKAKCQTSYGRWHNTSLQNFDRCNGGIVNDNGNLRCGREGNRGWYHGQNDHGQNGTPSGSYTRSCQDIRTSGNTLEANCSTSNGDWKRASLQDFNLCNGEIVNDNGRLRCNR
jgi:CVNH domain